MFCFRLNTQSRMQLIDITSQVRQAVRDSGVQSGLCVVYCPHTTAGITINEAADPDVARDLAATLARLVPEKGDYRHAEGNSDAHVKTTVVGPSQSLIVDNGNLVLGTWQGLFFGEFDGPRDRSYYVQIVKDHVE